MAEEPIQPEKAGALQDQPEVPPSAVDVAEAVAAIEKQAGLPNKTEEAVTFDAPVIIPEAPLENEATPVLEPAVPIEKPKETPVKPTPTLKERLIGGSVIATPSIPNKIEGQEVPKETPAPEVKAPAPETTKDQTSIRRLRTFKEDTQHAVAHKKASVVSIAAAESKRRADRSEEVSAPVRTFALKKILIPLVGLLFIGGGAGALWYVFGVDRSVTPPEEVQPTALIYADQAVRIELDGKGRTELMPLLTELRDETSLSLGLIRELYFTLPESAEVRRLATAAEFMNRVAPKAPSILSRSLDPEFFVGVHVFDGNQGLVILRTSLYEQAFSGMLEWELTLLNDLQPFLDRRARPLTPSELENLGTTTAPQIVSSGFTDAIIQNRDARVLKDERGEVLLLYTFLDRKTILITTNDRTLTEVVSRVRNAPIQGL